MKRFCLTIIIMFNVFLLNGETVINGIADLRNINLKEKIIILNGEWKFRWLEDNYNFSKMSYDAGDWDTINVPSFWNYKTNESFGYAWYRIKIKLSDKDTGQKLGINLKEIFSTADIFINGKLIKSIGVFGKTKNDSKPYYHKIIIEYDNENNFNEIILSLRISNFFSYLCGFNASPKISHIDNIRENFLFETISDSIVAGILFIICIYHLILFFTQLKNYSSLYLSLFSLTLFIRILFTKIEILKYIVLFDKSLPFLINKIDYITAALALVFITCFYIYYYEEKNRLIFLFFIFINISYSIFVLISAEGIYSFTAWVLNIELLLNALFLTFTAVKNTLFIRKYSFLIFSGTIIFLLVFIYEIFSALGLLFLA